MATTEIRTVRIKDGKNAGEIVEVYTLTSHRGDSRYEFMDLYEGLTTYDHGDRHLTERGAKASATKLVQKFNYGGLPLRIITCGTEGESNWTVTWQVH